MLLPRGLVQTFVEFVQRTYGVKMAKQPDRVVESQGLMYRGLWGERLLVVREHYPVNPEAETVEVHYSDREKLEDLETNWATWVYTQAEKEKEAINESDQRRDQRYGGQPIPEPADDDVP